VQQFAPPAGGWPNHRWIRFRTATAALSDWLAGLERGYADDPAYYDALLCDDDGQPSYKLSGTRLAAARERITALRDEIENWAQTPADAFTKNRPKQPPVLRLVPRTDTAAEPAPTTPASAATAPSAAAQAPAANPAAAATPAPAPAPAEALR
jgi:hypothetical protein